MHLLWQIPIMSGESVLSVMLTLNIRRTCKMRYRYREMRFIHLITWKKSTGNYRIV